MMLEDADADADASRYRWMGSMMVAEHGVDYGSKVCNLVQVL